MYQARLSVALATAHHEHSSRARAFYAWRAERLERAIVLDRKRPPSFDRIVEAALEAAPWTEAGTWRYANGCGRR